MSKKMAGKKFSGSHTTVIDAAFDVVRMLERNELVEKLALGPIRSCKASSGKRTIKTKDTASGLELVVRGNVYVQTVFVYLENSEISRRAIVDLINK